MIHLSSTYWCQDSLPPTPVNSNLPFPSPKKKKKKNIISSGNQIKEAVSISNLIDALEKTIMKIETDNKIIKHNTNQLSLFDTISEPQFKATKFKSIDDVF